MSKVYLLDLCCKAGGCSVGYERAAKKMGIDIEIVGVDIEPQKNYPYEFIQADAVDFLSKNLKEFTHIHASPPCQKHTTLSHPIVSKTNKQYDCIINPLRNLIKESRRPGLIENVPNAPIRNDIVLNGEMFGLGVIRIRHFEAVNWFSLSPLSPKIKGTVKNGDYITVAGKGSLKCKNGKRYKNFNENIIKTWSDAMGIDWMTEYSELANAIPPAYTHYIGLDFLQQYSYCNNRNHSTIIKQ